MQQVPTIGRIVHYRLNEADVERIRADRLKYGIEANGVAPGEVYPMLIVRVYGTTPDSYVSGTVFLDGEDTYRATSVRLDPDPEGKTPRHFTWPQRS